VSSVGGTRALRPRLKIPAPVLESRDHSTTITQEEISVPTPLFSYRS
jgi:hypothetical protein